MNKMYREVIKRYLQRQYGTVGIVKYYLMLLNGKLKYQDKNDLKWIGKI